MIIISCNILANIFFVGIRFFFFNKSNISEKIVKITIRWTGRNGRLNQFGSAEGVTKTAYTTDVVYENSDFTIK